MDWYFCKSIWPTGGHLENLQSDVFVQVLRRLLSNFTMLFLLIQSNVWPSIDTFANKNGRLAAILIIYEVIYFCKYLSDCSQILQCCSCLYKVMYDQNVDTLQINMADWRPSWIFANLRSDISLQVLERLLSNFTMLFLSIQSYVWPCIDTFANQYGRLAAILKIYEVIYLCKYLSDCCQILQCCSCLYKVMYGHNQSYAA